MRKEVALINSLEPMFVSGLIQDVLTLIHVVQ